MGGEVESIGIAEARSALAWWLEAGVDVAVQEEPRDWLKPAAPRSRGLPSRAAAQCRRAEPRNARRAPAMAGEQRPAAARSATAPGASSRTARRMPPVMLLSDAPALEDCAAGQPIGGEAWELAKRMLAAIGIAAEQAYSASLSCFHAPGARMSDRRARGLRRDRPPATSGWPGPSGCCCSATARAQALLGKPLAAGARPCPQDRGRAHRRHLPPAPAD